MLLAWRDLLADEEGASLTEYGLLTAAIAVPMIAAVGFLIVVIGNVLLQTGNGLTQIGTNP